MCAYKSDAHKAFSVFVSVLDIIYHIRAEFYYYLVLTVAIKKRSRVPGVMITQYIEELPPGKTTPDFARKPIAVTVQEGKTVIITLFNNIYSY